MKITSMFYSLLFSAAASALLMNCSGSKKGEHAGHDEHAAQDGAKHAVGTTAVDAVAEPRFQVDAGFQGQLAGVFTSYIGLKDALVASDANKVIEEAKSTNEALTKVDMKLLSGEAHNDWMNYITPLETSLKEILASTEIETQRKAFKSLSENLYKSLKAFGLGGKDAFYDYCPMALNDEGAYWLSDQKEIRNPYFGDKMLTCGQVKEQLK